MLLVVIGPNPVGENWGAKRRLSFEFNSSCWANAALAPKHGKHAQKHSDCDTDAVDNGALAVEDLPLVALE
ncbi:hypothetical protein NC652_030085 [Populus alba x Populus x berolinensis]|uniref:Uncharacterized protein n=1 Tax=Populus alba x Populus x berolinensis TaxID=444605 RepID=A0AAD6M444_9ROSI|nr:hypothetical protein NC652_030085 [Populus alba x Populus x berolinensis]KAJ6977999.1 hypothetical protein NC653_029789 [Populus alba x Populus x berolinensis]